MLLVPDWAYLGPPDSNFGGPMRGFMGLILHIAEGSYEGTISWQRNPVSDVSSHTVHGLAGERAQMLDINLTAWTQVAGNGWWVSAEHAGFSGDQLTADQLESTAHLYAWLVRVKGVPMQITDSPSVPGLGWHGMGGTAWGGHFDCPGEPIKAQRPAILARAQQILNGDDDMTPEQNRLLLNAVNVISGWSAGLTHVNQTFVDGHVELVDISGLYKATAALVECDGMTTAPITDHEHVPGAVIRESA